MAQLVARYLGVVEAAGSSPVTQTILRRHCGEVASCGRLLYNGGLPYFLHQFCVWDEDFSSADAPEIWWKFERKIHFEKNWCFRGNLHHERCPQNGRSLLVACDGKMCYTCVRELIGKCEFNGGYYGI